MHISNASADRQPVDVRISETTLRVIFSDGTESVLPLSYSSRLAAASPEERQNWEWLGNRSGIHWPEVDEDLSVSGIVRDAKLWAQAA